MINEKYVNIKTKDKHILYGVLNYAKKTDTLVIFVHGMGGGAFDDWLFKEAAIRFAKAGLATYRYEQYTYMPKARTLLDCSLGRLSDDLNRVMEYFKRKYKKIFLIGHSIGGPIILKSKGAKGIVLWDPSTSKIGASNKKIFIYDKKYRAYITKPGVQYLLPRRIFDDLEKCNDEDINNFKNKLVICASKGILARKWKKILKKEYLVVIEGADHAFTQIEAGNELLKITLSWIKRKK